MSDRKRKTPTSTSIVHYGELKCQHPDCKNGAYYKLQGKYLCGVHSKKDQTKRTTLPKMTSKEKEEHQAKRKKEENDLIEEYRKKNQSK
jgi:hypothetical protein